MYQGVVVNDLLSEEIAKFEEFIECLFIRDIFLYSVKERYVI